VTLEQATALARRQGGRNTGEGQTGEPAQFNRVFRVAVVENRIRQHRADEVGHVPGAVPDRAERIHKFRIG